MFQPPNPSLRTPLEACLHAAKFNDDKNVRDFTPCESIVVKISGELGMPLTFGMTLGGRLASKLLSRFAQSS
jgi:hypothetical protein